MLTTSIFLIAVSSVGRPVLADHSPPSRHEIASAMTFDRFDDSCNGPGPDADCPIVNVYRFVVRNVRCGPASEHDREKYGVRVASAFRYNFKSQITTYRTKPDPARWQDDSAVIYLSADKNWRAAPSGRR